MSSTRKYQHHDRDYWSRHIASWQISGLSQSEYCRQHDIPLSSFGNWKAKFTRENIPEQREPGFVKLERGTFIPQESEFFEIYLTDGKIFRIREDIPVVFLKNILNALGGM